MSMTGGTVHVELHLNRTVFVPGEVMQVNATITNDGNHEVVNVVTYLEQVCQY